MRVSAIIGALMASVAGGVMGGIPLLSEPSSAPRKSYGPTPWNPSKYRFVQSYMQTHTKKGRPLKNGPRQINVYTLRPIGRYNRG